MVDFAITILLALRFLWAHDSFRLTHLHIVESARVEDTSASLSMLCHVVCTLNTCSSQETRLSVKDFDVTFQNQALGAC